MHRRESFDQVVAGRGELKMSRPPVVRAGVPADQFPRDQSINNVDGGMMLDRRRSLSSAVVRALFEVNALIARSSSYCSEFKPAVVFTSSLLKRRNLRTRWRKLAMEW